MRNIKTLDRPIAFQRPLAGIAGGAISGLFLSQCVYWHNRTTDPEGWFYKTQSEWYEETMITPRQQETARQILKEKGYLEEKREGGLFKLHYRINVDKIMDDVDTWLRVGEKAFNCQSDEPGADSGLQAANEQTGQATSADQTEQNSSSHNIHRVHTEHAETTGPVDLKTSTTILILAEQFPEKLRTFKVMDAFNRYWKYRKARRLSLSDVCMKREFRTLEQYDEIMAVMAINRAIDRRWQKIWAFEAVDDIEPEYSEFIAAYKEFYKSIGKVYPPDPDDKGIIATNKIIKYIKSIVKNGQSVEAWKVLLAKYESWDQFYQKQIKLEQIYNNISNIILNIKNGTGTSNNKAGGGASVGTPENVARAFDKVDAYFGAPGQA